jgi:hypothetical protein
MQQGDEDERTGPPTITMAAKEWRMIYCNDPLCKRWLHTMMSCNKHLTYYCQEAFNLGVILKRTSNTTNTTPKLMFCPDCQNENPKSNT